MFDFFKKKKATTAEKGLITFGKPSPETAIDESRLIRISDDRIITNLTAMSANLGKILRMNSETDTAVNSVKGLGELFIAHIEPGARLMDSKTMPGAKRGGTISSSNKIGQANFESKTTDVTNALEITKRNQAVASLFGIASMIVGQYYMTQIFGEMDRITAEVERLSAFQNSEYLSKITSAMKELKEISDHQGIILQNDELRSEYKERLGNLKEKCTELLDQANHSIRQLMKMPAANYREYIERTTEIEKWFLYQSVLLELLYRISSLIKIFTLGMEPDEMIFSAFNQCRSESEAVSSSLVVYHKMKQDTFDIHVDEKTIGNPRWFQKIAGALGKDDWKQRQLPMEEIEKISLQMKPFTCDFAQPLDKFDEEITLVAKDGELYYLPK